MPSRKQTFLETVQDLQEEFLLLFPKGPTTSTQSITDRIRRSLSWLRRVGEVSDEDLPPRFLDLWIALNALYGQARYTKEFESRDKEEFGEFVQRLAELQSGKGQLGQLISKKHFQKRVRDMTQNKYLWNEWWSRKLNKYQEKSGKEVTRLENALRYGDSGTVLSCLFERLHVLRNQIVHGSSSASTRKSRDALYPAVLLLEEMLPEFIRLMMREKQGPNWPPVPYPAKGTLQHPEQS